MIDFANPVVDLVIGVGVGVLGISIGIVVAYYFYRQALRDMVPMWAINNRVIVDRGNIAISNVVILYQETDGTNQEIQTLSIAKIRFWNQGRRAIRSGDIDGNDPFRIIPSRPGVRLLDVELIEENSRSRSQLNVQRSPDASVAEITFDHLNAGWGGVFQVAHTGNAVTDIAMSGSVIDGKDLRKIEPIRVYEVLDTAAKNVLPLLPPGPLVLSMGFPSALLASLARRSVQQMKSSEDLKSFED